MPNIGERLKEERERLGLSQIALAERCNVTPRSIRNYERGERQPDAAFLNCLSQIGADILYIVAGRREQSLPMDDIDRLTTAIRLVEAWIEAHDVELEPKKKAEVVALAYEMLADRKGGEEKVERMLRLVA